MSTLLPFMAVTIPLVLTPGVSTAVVLRNGIAGGMRGGLITAVGINAGSLCYGQASSTVAGWAWRRCAARRPPAIAFI